MARTRFKSILGATIAGGLFMSSTSARASAPSAPHQVDPWAVLAAMSGGAPAATICSSAAVTATNQTSGCVLPVVDPLPPATAQPPLAAGTDEAGINSLLTGLVAIVASVEIYFAVHGSGRHANSPA